MTVKELKSKASKVEDYNTNNDWGFGGKYGKRFYFDTEGDSETYCEKGKYCYRHTGTSKQETFILNGKQVDSNEFNEAIEKI